jgi:gliding motility-associated lipoprotein GldH
MLQLKSQKMNRLKFILPLCVMLLALVSCNNNNLVDSNVTVAENSWTYAKSAKAVVEIKEAEQPHQIYFKLRHTADYRYSNLFVLMRLKGDGINKTIRYQFKLAKGDGEWLGKGSGDLYTHNFPLLTNYHFPKPGKYTIEIEQNMRDNPLLGISDIGITVMK